MGEKRNRVRKMLAEHPNCIYCGSRSITEDHCPPRAMFQERKWPEGFSFPCCQECNSGSSDDDLIVSFMARQNPFSTEHDKDGKTIGLLHNLRKQVPSFLRDILPTANESRSMNRSLGINLPSGMLHQESGVVKVIPRMTQAVETLARKLTKGIYWMQTGKVLPQSAQIALYWFTNTDLFTRGTYHAFEVLLQLEGTNLPTLRSNKYLDSQFSIRVSISEDQRIMALGAEFGRSFGFVTFASTIPNQLSEFMIEFRNRNPRDEDPIQLIQE